ncbi:hypothetical protein ACEPAF_3886 [Sanghuangporus sanghuang]
MTNSSSIATTPAYTIRDADEADLPGMLEILNEQVATNAAILRDDPFDLEDRRKWMRDTKNAGFPIFVAVPSDLDSPSPSPSVLGFAYYNTFRPREGYRFTAENTIYVHKSIRGGKIGTALMERLLSFARDQGNVHALIGAITASNVDSIRFHERFGFVDVGTMREVGYKFGEWQDVTFMQLILPGGGPSKSGGK